MPSIGPKEHLQSIERSSERHLGRDGYVCLDRNERLSDFPEAAFRDMMARLTPHDLTAYPDAGPFVTRLSTWVGLPESHIAELAGSDAGIRRIFMAFLRPGAAVVALNPAYAMYELYARIFQGTLINIDYGADRRYDVEAFVEAIHPGTGIAILANPDQPSGMGIDNATIRRIVTRARDVGAVCAIDEAYHPFHPVTAAPLVPEFDNLVVFRSFSKYPGCAGLRLGYALAHPRVIEGLMKVRGSSEVSGPSLALGCYLLDHPEIAEDFRRAVEEGRRIVVEGARRLGLEAPTCATNFQLLRVGASDDIRAVVAALASRRYLVKAGFAHPAFKDCMRVTLNGPEIMAPFMSALADVLGALRGSARTVQ